MAKRVGIVEDKFKDCYDLVEFYCLLIIGFFTEPLNEGVEDLIERIDLKNVWSTETESLEDSYELTVCKDIKL